MLEFVYGLVKNILTVRMVCLAFHAVLIAGISIYCGPGGGSVLMDGVYYSGRNILSYAPFLFGADFLMIDISTSSAIIEEFMRSREAGLASVASFYFDFPDSSKQDFRGELPSLLARLSTQSDACCGILECLYSEHDSSSKLERTQ